MQLRKLIRLLEEAKKKHGDRIECCIDTKLGESMAPHHRYYSISDIETHECFFDKEGWGDAEEKEREVLVLGNC